MISVTASVEKKLVGNLKEISRFLILNSSLIQNPGLFAGDIGSTIFLYHYENYIDDVLLFNLCNEAVLRNIQKINKDELSYEDGAAGIAWSINYLGKKEFIEAPAPSISSNIDTLIVKKCQVSMDVKSLALSSYLLSNLGRPELNEAPHDKLLYLLKKERLIAHVDKIQSEHLLKKLIIPIMSLKGFKNDSDSMILMDKIAELGVISNFLRLVFESNIYPEIISKLLNELYDALITLKKRFLEVMTLVCVSGKQSIYFEFFMIRLYAIIVEVSRVLSKEIQEKDFIECLYYISQQKERWEKYNSSPLDSYSIFTLASLNKINSQINNKSLTECLLEKINKDVLPEIESGRIFNAFNNGNTCNIGVTGIAGVGLNILQLLDHRVNGWEESMLLC